MKKLLKLYRFKEWKTDYEIDTDTLYLGKFPMVKDAVCYYIEGVHYYISRQRIVGIFIEYFSSQVNEKLRNKFWIKDTIKPK